MTVNADILKKYSNYTYVESTHPNIWEYVGNVSVKGSDWIRLGGNNAWAYPSFSRITYRVPRTVGGWFGQYDEHTKTVYSQGMNDSVQRKSSIIVKDNLNPFNVKTQVLWNINLVNRQVNPGDPVPWSIGTDVSE